MNLSLTDSSPGWNHVCRSKHAFPFLELDLRESQWTSFQIVFLFSTDNGSSLAGMLKNTHHHFHVHRHNTSPRPSLAHVSCNLGA